MAEGQPISVLLPYQEGAVAIWQRDLVSDVHVMAAYLGDKLPVVNGINKGGKYELQAVSSVHDPTRIAYIQSSNDSEVGMVTQDGRRADAETHMKSKSSEVAVEARISSCEFRSGVRLLYQNYSRLRAKSALSS